MVPRCIGVPIIDKRLSTNRSENKSKKQKKVNSKWFILWFSTGAHMQGTCCRFEREIVFQTKFYFILR